MEVRCGDHLQTVLRLSFLGLTLYLLHEEVALYCTVLYCTVLYCTVQVALYLRRPTVSSAAKVALLPRHFPVITVCPLNPFDLASLELHGYGDQSFNYAMGVFSGTERGLGGWRGRLNASLEQVMRDISTIKQLSDCPTAIVKFRRDQNRNQKLEFRLTPPIHPHGQVSTQTNIL